MQTAIAAGKFRSDLFYRLNVFPLEMPPLRERREDIPLLVSYFLDRYGRKAGKRIRNVQRQALDLLQSYSWPGNIRELQNVIERSVILCETQSLSVDESWLFRPATFPQAEGLAGGRAVRLPLWKRSEDEEKQAIEAALAETGGRVAGPRGAAARLAFQLQPWSRRSAS